jgi:DNA-binding response OmpR family regulator
MSDVFILEDSADIAEGLRRNLEVEGYSVEIAGTASAALEAIRANPPELLILDLMLPDEDGFRVLRLLRGEGFEMPVLILSARASEVEKVRGFRLGADDYVTKPFGLDELMARVDALFRRRLRPSVSRQPATTLGFADVKVDFARREVRRAGVLVALRPKEFELLEALAQRANRVVSRRELLETVWGYEEGVVTRTIDTHVAELRRKIEADPADPQTLITVRKAGYMLRI